MRKEGPRRRRTLEHYAWTGKEKNGPGRRPRRDKPDQKWTMNDMLGTGLKRRIRLVRYDWTRSERESRKRRMKPAEYDCASREK